MGWKCSHHHLGRWLELTAGDREAGEGASRETTGTRQGRATPRLERGREADGGRKVRKADGRGGTAWSDISPADFQSIHSH